MIFSTFAFFFYSHNSALKFPSSVRKKKGFIVTITVKSTPVVHYMLSIHTI